MNAWPARTEQTTTIRRTAGRETCVSRQYLGHIEGPSETPPTSQHYGIEVFKGDL